MKKQEELKDTIFQYAGQHLKRADRVYGWGCCATGALGRKTLLKPEKHQHKRTKQLTPLKLDFFSEYNLKPVKIACGYGNSVMICKNKKTDAYSLFGTGINTDSQLGYHEFPRKSGRILDMLIEWAVINLPFKDQSKVELTHVACGRSHTLVATNQGEIFTLGNNSQGQCGRTIIDGELHRGSQKIGCITFEHRIKDMVCGQDHSLILTEEGKVFSCGLGADGQTGLGHYENVSEFTQVRGVILDEKIIQISSKADTTLAVSDRGEIFGWGNSEYDQLTDGSEMQVFEPRRLSFADVGRVVRVAASGSSCALLNEDGQVFTWGYGALGQGLSVHSRSQPQIIPPQLFGLNEYSHDKASTLNTNTPKNSTFTSSNSSRNIADKELNFIKEVSNVDVNDVNDLNDANFASNAASSELITNVCNRGRVIDIDCGLHYFAALSSSGDLYTWGKNKYAMLGLGHDRDQFFPFKVQIPAEVKQLGCGVDHLIVLSKSFL